MAGKSGAIKAGAAYVEIFADKSPLMRGLKSAEASVRKWGQSISSFGKQMMGMGTAIVAPLVSAAKYLSTYGDNIAKASKRTGIGVESLSALGFAAEQSGSNLEGVEKGVRKMQQSILDANMGLKATTEIFGMLGLSADSFKGLKPEEQFKLIADKLSQIQDPSTRAAIAMKIFGRAGTQLLPMMEKGAAGINELMEEAKRLGLVMSSEDALAAEELNDALNRMWRTIKMSFANIGAAVAPIITDLSNKIAVLSGKISNWIKENRGLFRLALMVGAGLIATGGAFVVLGNAMMYASKVFAIIRGGFALLKNSLMFLMSPIGIVIAAVTALTAIFLYFTGYGSKLIDWLGSRFASLKDDVTNAVGGISAALAKGDFALAARIGWLLVKMEWLKAKMYLLQIWYSVKLAVMEVWYGLIYGLTVAWEACVFGIAVAWTESVALIQKIWVRAGSLLKGAWITVVQFFKNVWIGFKEWWGNTIDWVAKKLFNVYIWWKKLTDANFDEAAARKQADETFAQDKKERESNADAGRLAADKQADDERLKLEQDTQNSLKEIEDKRAKRRENASRRFDTGMDMAGQYFDDGIGKTMQGAEDGLQGAADELAATKNQFRQSIEKAKKTAETKQPALVAPKADLQANTGLAKATTIGTFSAFGLGQLGAGGGVMQKIADASARTANATEEIADNMGDGGMEFGE
ncbi:MAG: hypothetical protein A2Y12_01385 [Planctomycetes bacterium GWF2_42_9]|nr:MAG: hypothetical protein A2Y12_01385 [Planctomycetes bacterium GWF2_42_9]